MTDPKIAIEAEKLAGGHSECEDGWYSCPLSEGGCLDDRQEGCNCGRGSRVAAIAQALRSSRRAAYQKCLDAVPEEPMIQDTRYCKTHETHKCEDCASWNSARRRLIAAALQHGFTLAKDGLTLE
jgi:hypothetical protein